MTRQRQNRRHPGGTAIAVLLAFLCAIPAATVQATDKANATDSTSRDTLYVMQNDTLYTLCNDSVCPTQTDAQRYDYIFLTAMAKFNAGDDSAADMLLDSCSRMMPDRSEAYFYLSKHYDRQGNDSLKTEMMRKAAQLDPDNITYKEAMLPEYINANDMEKAIGVMEDILDTDPERTELLLFMLQIYEYQKDYGKCIETIQRIETKDGESEDLTLMKIQAYTAMGDDKKVMKEFQSLIKSHPLDSEYKTMLGNYLLQKNKRKEALRLYSEVLAEEPENETALISMMDYYRAVGNDSLAAEQRNRLLFSPKTQDDTKQLLLRQFIRESEQASTDSTQVIALFDRMLQQPQTDTSILETKIAYMQMKQMPADTIKTALAALLERAPENVQARLQLIQMAWEKKDGNEIVRLAKPAVEYNADEWSFLYFLGIGYFLNDDFESCVKVLTEATTRFDEKNDKAMAVEIYEMLGDALYSLDRKAEAFEAYEKCLKLDPDKISCLNNYAYYIAEEGGDIERAAEMSLKTVKAEPNNATYLDTYAWILFKQHRYEEAKIYIDLALKNLNKELDNSVIIEHGKQIETHLKKQ